MKRVKLRTIPLPELNKNDITDSVQRLLIIGHSNREIKKILNLSDGEFTEAQTLLRAVNVNSATAEQAFAEFADVYTVFQIRCNDKLKQLQTLLEQSSQIDPFDGCAMNPSGARRVIREMTKIDQALMTATTQLLLLKHRLGLIVAPEQPQLPSYENGNGHLVNGNDPPLFSQSNIRAAWKLREQKLLN